MDVVVTVEWPDRHRAVAALGEAGAPPHPPGRAARRRATPSRWDPEPGTIDAAALEGHRRRGAPRRRGHRRQALDRRAEAPHPRESHAGHLAARRRAGGLDAAAPVLVCGSAIGYYGDRGDDVLTEAEPAGEGFLAELVVGLGGRDPPAEAAGIRVAHPRTGIVLAADGGALADSLPLFKLGLGGRLGSGPPVLERGSPSTTRCARHPPPARPRRRRAGQPHRAQPGDQRRVHQGARRGAAPPASCRSPPVRPGVCSAASWRRSCCS